MQNPRNPTLLQQMYLELKNADGAQVKPLAQSRLFRDGHTSPSIYAPLQHNPPVHDPVLLQHRYVDTERDSCAHFKPVTQVESRLVGHSLNAVIKHSKDAGILKHCVVAGSHAVGLAHSLISVQVTFGFPSYPGKH